MSSEGGGARFTDPELLTLLGAGRRGLAPRGPFVGVSTDTRSLQGGELFVALQGPSFDAHDFLDAAAGAGAAGAVVRRGRSLEVPPGLTLYEVDEPLEALGALAAAHRRRFPIPVGAVAGSNGKTTTKEMVGAILEVGGPALRTRGNLNNAIGVPLTLLRLDGRHRSAVVELGMNHPGEVTTLTRMAAPTAGMLTVVQEEHLEGLASLDGVAEAEGELFEALPPDAVAVVNLDDPRVVEQSKRAGARRRIGFGRAEGADVRVLSCEPDGDRGQRVRVAHAGEVHELALAFLGPHNAVNAAGAFALARALGVTPDACVAGLAAARPYSGRLVLRKLASGLTLLDDTYNANPSSMDAALTTLASLAGTQRAVAVLGDMLELGETEAEAHRALGRDAVGRVRALRFFGPRSRLAAESASARAGREVGCFEDVASLIESLLPELRSDDVVLVKGSRGVRLERVVEALRDAHGGEAAR